MKFNDFKKSIKKEFNENYNEENKEKSKSHVSIWIKLIPVYAVGLLVILLVLIFTIPHTFDGVYSEYENNINLYSEGVIYRDLKKLSGSDIQKYRDYIAYEEAKANKNIIWGSIGVGGAGQAEVDVSPGNSSNPDTSFETNNQEEGVIESDIAKSDGTYIYYVSKGTLVIYDLSGNQVVNKYDKDYTSYGTKLEVFNDKIIVYNAFTLVIYSFDGTSLNCLYSTYVDVDETRLVGNYLYFVSSRKTIYDTDTELYYDELNTAQRITTITKINLTNMEKSEVKFASSSSNVVYMNNTHIVFSNRSFFNYSKRDFCLNSVFDLDLNPVGVFVCDGGVLDQYSIDVYQNQLRIVSTTNDRKNCLTIFDLNDKCIISSIKEGIGLKNETVKSVTFTDTTCYVVTYLQTDPLYEIDLTDPKNPKIVDALKVEGYSSYLKPFTVNGQEYIFAAGIINGEYKYSVYKNDEANTQVGFDYYVGDGENLNLAYYYDLSSSVNPHAMRFFQKDDILYVFAPVYYKEVAIYMIDVSKYSNEVIQKYKKFDTATESRIFLINGICYIPQIDKLIMEDFLDKESVDPNELADSIVLDVDGSTVNSDFELPSNYEDGTVKVVWKFSNTDYLTFVSEEDDPSTPEDESLNPVTAKIIRPTGDSKEVVFFGLLFFEDRILRTKDFTIIIEAE